MIPLLAAVLAISSSFAQAELQFSDQRVRAVPPSQTVTGGFVTITNTGNSDLAIVEASSPISEVVELHTHIRQDDKMMMRRIPQIDLPAMGTTMLQPGGLHLMFIGLKQPLAEGDQVEVNIKLNDGSSEQLVMPVQMVQPMMQGHQHGNQMKHAH